MLAGWPRQDTAPLALESVKHQDWLSGLLTLPVAGSLRPAPGPGDHLWKQEIAPAEPGQKQCPGLALGSGIARVFRNLRVRI